LPIKILLPFFAIVTSKPLSIRIAIVDDKQVNRTTVREKLMPYPEVELVMEATNGEDFLEQLQSISAERRPTVVLMDLEMPEMDGIQTIALASPPNPDLKFIVLTVFEDNEKIFEAIRAGAHGYLLKDEKAVNIIEAITQVVEMDGMPMSPIVARKAMQMLKKVSTIPSEIKTQAQTNAILSDREMDILVELATGKSYKAIGEKLFISPFTVRKHVSNIYNKLHVDSRTQIINVAQKNRWV
jgi:DNA-binding NarL/FixJ family response regulator